ncbi:hypothetical protein ABZ355_09960, partial [Streptomyces sp. NPDC005989]
MSGDNSRLRSGLARLLRPAGLLLFLITEVLLAEGGSLSAAVAVMYETRWNTPMSGSVGAVIC